MGVNTDTYIHTEKKKVHIFDGVGVATAGFLFYYFFKGRVYVRERKRDRKENVPPKFELAVVGMRVEC